MSTSFVTVTCAELATMKFPPIAPEPAEVPTWQNLVDAEPRLLEVERLALTLHPRAAVDDWLAWSTIKHAMAACVGWTAEQYSLRTAAAYGTAYDYLLGMWECGR